jgi:rhodanese-related sulfurtransferase
MVNIITRQDLLLGLLGPTRPTLVEALPAKYYEHAHLPGAININHDEVDRLSAQTLPRKDAAIVVYCANAACKNSHMAAERLVALGYGSVSVYAEGKQDWIEAGLPVVKSPGSKAA